MNKPKKLHCSECDADVFEASRDDEQAGVMCIECSQAHLIDCDCRDCVGHEDDCQCAACYDESVILSDRMSDAEADNIWRANQLANERADDLTGGALSEVEK